MNNIIFYNLQLKYYNTNMFRSSLGYLHGWRYLKMRRKGSKYVDVVMI